MAQVLSILGIHKVTKGIMTALRGIHKKAQVDNTLVTKTIKVMIILITGISRGVPSKTHGLMKDTTRGTHHLHSPISITK